MAHASISPLVITNRFAKTKYNILERGLHIVREGMIPKTNVARSITSANPARNANASEFVSKLLNLSSVPRESLRHVSEANQASPVKVKLNLNISAIGMTQTLVAINRGCLPEDE